MQLHSRLRLLPLSNAPAFLRGENSVSENVVKTRIERLVHFSRLSRAPLARFFFFLRLSPRAFRSPILLRILTDRELRSRESLSRIKDRIFASAVSKFGNFGISVPAFTV